ncbi:protein-tyrosine phosphatase [Acetanaerobacterium elongatum]|uniref:Protein-tyrosine phosphatase n=2 Tax=Acetanaerobacterium elongatum TaxID=258515 RepID=A0A1G9V742_9FIRM|nr:protein-tyrosine phosphatase [Acetanaerobacterium elongatum]
MDMKKILFVCTGNTCRSPMAQGLCQKYISENALVGQFGCASAGLDVKKGARISENALIVMNEIGVDMSSHRAKMVTAEMMQEADCVFTMSSTHKNMLEALFPKDANKIRVLGHPIFDPYGQNLEFYRFSRDSLKDKVYTAMDEFREDLARQKALEEEEQHKAELFGGIYGRYY